SLGNNLSENLSSEPARYYLVWHIRVVATVSSPPAQLPIICWFEYRAAIYGVVLLDESSSRQCCESCEVKVLAPPIACSRADRLSDACKGNDARSARM